MSDGKEKCQSCKKKGSDDLHTCPFREEINDDSEILCNCCEDCTDECAMEI